ncbi:MAG TPA: hypothetical protein VH500_01390 [Nitrososphaeraceae archaeon]|jgi:hypothetical protein
MESKIVAVIVFLIANLFAIGLSSSHLNFVNPASAAASNSTNANQTAQNSIETTLQSEAMKINPQSTNDVQLTTTKNTITLGNPFYIEYVKTIRQQPLVLNTGLRAIGIIFIGKGTVNGTNFVQTEGKALVIPLSRGIADVVGGGLIKATPGNTGNATYNFRETANYNSSAQSSGPTGNPIKHGIGAAIFNSNATGSLSFLSNKVIMFKDEGNSSGVSTIRGWDWK